MIIVLGPGRCGSSTIARLLHNNLGVSMGKRFRESNPSNPKGFFEDLDFLELNQAILEGRYSINHFKKQLGKLIQFKNQNGGIKDPRICHLWQYYRKYPAKYILCTRRPQLIIRSMIQNYGWSEEESKQLLMIRLNGIDKLLEGKDSLRIDFSDKRNDLELINLLKRFLT